ncbi:OprD family outer membrane porin [Parendozoicomonas sp. Alg238-R29]|uniref:OprD family outer membrane porin n=1 Tax=Parendozoicomonas sp. Alg238-R29 TaxID=2993446 RepID=UPI00248E142F|nr:OprD family outer membrane porin [Parendozoicomonas sp. Alg238-R29]
MKLKASLLSAAIAAAVATTSAQAAEVVTFDPSLKLSYKNHLWDEDYDYNNVRKSDGSLQGDLERDEWAQAIIADFDTGYINNVIGAVVTVGAAHSLKNNDDSSNSNLPTGSDGEANDFAGVQQAYLKAKYALGDLNLGGSWGVKKRGFELFGNSGSRILSASSYGLDVTAEYMGLNLYASNLTGGSKRDQSSFNDDYSSDYVRIVGASYSVAGVDLSAEHLRAEDFVKKNFLKAAYSLPLAEDLSADFDVRYATADADSKSGNEDSNYYNLNATLNFGNAYVGAGYNRTRDGDWIGKNTDTNLGNDDTFNSSLSQWADYSAKGEKAYLLTAGYNFADLGLPGLSIDLATAKGSDKADTSKFDRREWSSYVSYAFDGQLEGLSVAWYHYDYSLDERGDTDTVTAKSDEKGDRLYLKYSVSVF